MLVSRTLNDQPYHRGAQLLSRPRPPVAQYAYMRCSTLPLPRAPAPQGKLSLVTIRGVERWHVVTTGDPPTAYILPGQPMDFQGRPVEPATYVVLVRQGYVLATWPDL